MQGLDELSDDRQLALLVSQATDYAIFAMDPDGIVQTWNPGAERMNGYQPEEIIGRHFSTFYTEEDKARRHPANELRIAAATGRYEEEGWRVRKDGSRFWASIVITALHDDAARLIGFGKVSRDLTERKHAQEELERVVEELRIANDELDRFAAVAAHDMTDPLRTISGFAEFLLNAEPTEEKREQYIQHIFDSSQRLSAMLHGLLAYARAGRPREASTDVDVTTAVNQARDDLAAGIAERATRIVVEVPTEARVCVDPDDLRIILQNLVSNAVKFADRADPVVTIGAVRGMGEWQITVADNGVGIPPEHQERIFAAFERAPNRRSVGYGLGLAICQRLVERHGGRIGLESGPGTGTRFWFSLPDRAPTEELEPADENLVDLA
jgi:PAS domain S-box-containing protein